MAPMTHSEPGFSLIAGGPVYRLQQRLGLTKSGTHGLAKRVALCVLLTWVPLLALSAAEGRALGGEVRIPFLYDFGTYALFLVAVPLPCLTVW
jgi:hypothetical protein